MNTTSISQGKGREMQSSVLRKLSNAADSLGKGINYVQGAGGNLSYKDENVLVIKASGTRFSDAANTNIFLELPVGATQKKVLETEDLSSIVKSSPSSRPSIETAIHALLPHTYVLHLHSVASLSRAILINLSTYADELKDLAAVAVVPYAKPGIPLAHAILEVLPTQNMSPENPLIVLLGNHGIIIAGPAIELILNIVRQIDERWNPQQKANVPVEINENGWKQIAAPDSVSSAQAILLSSGVLTPDQAVFLGESPFSLGMDKGSEVSIEPDGSVWARAELSKDSIEIAQSFISIVQNLPPEAKPIYLSAKSVHELLNWDAEIWRKAQER